MGKDLNAILRKLIGFGEKSAMFRFAFWGENCGVDVEGAKVSCCRAQDMGLLKPSLLLQVRTD